MKCYWEVFFQLFNWFQLFFCEKEIWKLQDTVRTGQKWLFKGGVDGFNYFHWFSVILFSIQNHPGMYNSNKSSVPLICVLSVKLDSRSCTFTSISFLTNYINRLFEILMVYQWLSLGLCILFQDPLSQFFLANLDKDVWALGQLWSWSYDSWIYNYLWNQGLSPLKLWVRILIRRGIPVITWYNIIW